MSAFDPRYDPAFQPGWDGPSAETLPERARPQETPRVAPATSERMVVVAGAEPEEQDDSPTRRINPFLVAIGAVAVLLVLAGLWMAWRATSVITDPSASQIDYAMLQMFLFAAPFTVLLGVASGIGILFAFAVRWRPSA